MGDQSVIVYSDEHGEAMVKYVPGWEFYFDAITEQNSAVETPLGGCDLQDISPLGTAEIKATARYPVQSLDTDKVSNVLTESTYNSFLKEVTCAPKGPALPERTSYICTGLSVDIDGTAMAQSRVCFSAQGATSITSYPAGTPFTLDGVGKLCVETDWDGDAQVEVLAPCSIPNGSVRAEFADEGIVRTTAVDFSYCTPPPTTSTTTTTPTTTTTTPTTTTRPVTTTRPSTTTTPPATTTPTTTTTPSTTTTTPTSPPAGIALLRIKTVTLAGKRARVVEVRVNGPARTAKLELRLVKANGKTLRRVTRSVTANRVVRVPKLKLDRVVTSVAAKLLSASGATGSPAPGGQPAAATVALVRITTVVADGKTSRVVDVRVNGPGKTAKIEVRLVKSNGKTLRRVTRVIATNRVARVPQLKLDSIVKTVRVTLA
jgi:hypothetical protein